MPVIEINGFEHEIGDTDCKECWSGYPKPCRCGGLIHATFGDENYDMDYWLYYKCDKCGSTNPEEDS